jgi:histidine ammonia-lyase
MLELNGYNLTVENIHRVAREREQISLSDDALEKIKKCRVFLDEKVASGEMIYGVNTGIGEFSETRLPEDKLKEFQKYLVYNHSAGIGEPMPEEYARGAMVGRINVHAKGYSAVRPEITLTMIEMLNKGLTPVMAQRGSVGACGDLSPMAQAAQNMMGEGEVFYNGERRPAREAMEEAGVEIPGLDIRDGLGFINGSNVLTAMSALHIYDMERLMKQFEIAASMSLEALLGNLKPYDSRLHTLRGFSGAVASAANISKCFEGSDLLTGKTKTKLQDAYSMRSTPQVIGAARDAIAYARSQVEIELNGVCDNPIFLPDDELVLSGANFQGSPIAVPMDMAGAAVTMVSVLSERRLNRLLNPALSAGLPAFLATDPGFYSGLMLSQYTADSLIVEQRTLSAPASIQSIPAAADQEDFVSMGMTTAIQNKQIIDHACGVLGIEFMAAAQSLNFRDFEAGKGVQAAHATIRQYVPFLDEDRPLHNDHDTMQALVKSNEILTAVEEVVGELN